MLQQDRTSTTRVSRNDVEEPDRQIARIGTSSSDSSSERDDTSDRSLLGMMLFIYLHTHNTSNIEQHINVHIVDRMTDVASSLISTSAPIARAIEQGLNIIGQREAAQVVGLARQASETIRTTSDAVNFVSQHQNQITNYLTISVNQIQNYFSGSSTTDEPSAEAFRVSGAPTEADPQGVPSAPQLSTSSDPLPATDPMVSYSQ